MFKPVISRVNLPQMEVNILKLWKDGHIFEKSVDQRRDKPLFTLYEGPPTANSSPGIHFTMPRILKDIIPRYKAMKGYYTPRIGGWDTHGLPVELEIEKKLGFSGKTQIEEYGIEKFNALCRQSVLGYIKEFEEVTERIAFWVDLEHAYLTMNNSYIETVWWAIKQMWDKGLVYQGYRVTPHCPRCGTSLSSHEVAQGYQDNTEDPSVYIKFRLVEKEIAGFSLDRPSYILAWTTTPWTLPGNTALAVAPDAEYVVLEVENEYIIMASAMRESAGLGDARIVTKLELGYIMNLCIKSILFIVMMIRKHIELSKVILYRWMMVPVLFILLLLMVK
jgi:isoleucyl-tRNA synthetase